MGATRAAGVGKNCDSRRISGYRIDGGVRSANNNCDRPPCTDHHEEERTECSLFVRSGKSKAKVTDTDTVTIKYTRPTKGWDFEWPGVTLNDLAKYSMTPRSMVRSLCDSRASCWNALRENHLAAEGEVTCCLDPCMSHSSLSALRISLVHSGLFHSMISPSLGVQE